MTGNRRDGELDIVLLSTKDGSVIRNLTSGLDQDRGFEYIATPGMRWNSVPWMSWSPVGDRLAYFARTEKRKSLILQNIVNGKIEQRVTMDVDEPESPNFHPNGRLVAFSALRNAVGDIFTVNLDTLEVTNLTNDALADYAPTFSPDGKYHRSICPGSAGTRSCSAWISATKQKTQLTFGTHDDTGAKFIDADTVVFSSTATNPTEPVEAEVAKNGNIYNIWTLNLKNGELRQYSDAVGGNLSAIVLPGDKGSRLAFVSYYKGEYSLNTLERKEPLQTAASSDFGAPGPVTDFQAPLTHTIVAENKRKKGTFEKMYLDGRPPVNVGVTSGGDVFGGTQITFSDVLGDKQFNVFAASISQYRTFMGSYVNLSRRLQYAIQGYSTTQFFYGQYGGMFYDPAFNGFIDRDLAQATRTIQGGSAFAIYPFNRYRRVEASVGVLNYNESYNDQALQDYSNAYQQQLYGTTLFRNGTSIPFGAAFVQETTVFREFGPLKGSTVRLGYEVAPPFGQPARASDVRCRRPLLPATRRLGPAGDAVPRLQEHRRGAGLHVLRRQLRDARLRLPPVRWPERRVRERRAAIPADRGDAHPARRARRHPRCGVRKHGRRLLPEPRLRLQVLYEQQPDVHADHRLPEPDHR